MKIEEWKQQFEKAIVAQIEKMQIPAKMLKFDVGVFPWHASIELSALFEGDESDNCFVDDIASWPAYNFSEQYEGKWPAVISLVEVMGNDYKKTISSKVTYFKAVAEVMKRNSIQKLLKGKGNNEKIEVSVFDVDSDENYMMM